MEAARGREHRLPLAEGAGERREKGRGDRQVGRRSGERRPLSPARGRGERGDVLDRGAAADAASRAHHGRAAGAPAVGARGERDDADVLRELGRDTAFGRRLDRHDLADLLDDALSEEKAGDEVVVVARRPHRDDEPLGLGAAFTQADLERLLGDEGILLPARALLVAPVNERRHRSVAVRIRHPASLHSGP